jgi:prepilin-type N-terminal cleavage/methylation domain-containing protein
MRKRGFTVLEILIALFIFSIFLIPITIFIQKYQRGYFLQSSCEKIIEGVNFARESAINERCDFSVIFNERSFKILKEGNKIVWKEIKFPDYVKIKEKTKGVDPLIFLPDGTAKEAGYIVIMDEITKKEKKIKIHNVTGKCILEN